MTRTVACFSLVLAAAACHPLDKAGSEFATGVPRQQTVAMSVPGSGAKALTVESSSRALEGQTAEWYRITRAVSVTVNAGAIAVGTLVRLVTDYPATSVGFDTAVWGPWQGPLDPIEWMVTITRVAAHQYQYKFEGRDKHQPTAPFVTVLSGVHSPGLDGLGNEMEGFGTGSFTLDWDARATLPAPDANVGKANYVYDHMGPGQVINISAQFRQVKDDDHPGRLVDADYVFVQNPGAEGSMDFTYNVPADATSTEGVGKVRSRWLWSGAGRSDVTVTATDLPQTYTLTECWDINYASTYKSVPLSTNPADNYGSEATCAFAAAEYPTL
ncbi:MAG: hypothetical protein JXP73_12445 [Deltaproteobacteria bacterium]|jgi:hypothetical protein|nr:hypothetical protein [Deltaproteobacteria bacterium]